MKRLLLLVLIGLSPLLSADTSKVRFTQGWIKQLPPVVPMRAGYVQIRNPTKQAHEIISLQSEAFDRIEMHETRMIGGTMSMQELDTLPLAPGFTEELKPGGKHLMLIGPRQALEIGQDIDVIATFEDDSSQRFTLEVRR